MPGHSLRRFVRRVSGAWFSSAAPLITNIPDRKRDPSGAQLVFAIKRKARRDAK
jgi:hypothetical protein